MEVEAERGRDACPASARARESVTWCRGEKMERECVCERSVAQKCKKAKYCEVVKAERSVMVRSGFGVVGGTLAWQIRLQAADCRDGDGDRNGDAQQPRYLLQRGFFGPAPAPRSQ
jgi:hypothetical protein